MATREGSERGKYMYMKHTETLGEKRKLAGESDIPEKGYKKEYAEKRKLAGNSDTTDLVKKKIGMSFTKTSLGSNKISMSIGSKKSIAPVKINLGEASQRLKAKDIQPEIKKSSKVAAVFNSDEESEEEEMPPEARMKMRNVGRDTPTAAGPNSFGKNKQGFCDSRKMFEKNLQKQMDEVGEKD